MSHISKPAKILVVDDEESITEMVSAVLKQHGHSVKEINDPPEAIKVIEDWMPDLVVLDYAMPELDGPALLKIIRQRESYMATIFVSGFNDQGRIVEILNEGADDYIKKPFSFDEFAARVNVRLRLKELHDELGAANRKLKDLSETDDVTGLLNMRSMYDRIGYALKQGSRYERHVCCVMLDIDHFKRVNDDHDHLFGSFVLKELGKIIEDNIRDVDFAARYGGDEFLIVLTETSVEGAYSFAERLRKAAKDHLFTDGKESMRITLSLGMAVSDFKEELDARGLVRRADAALYQSKEGGRDSVNVYDKATAKPK